MCKPSEAPQPTSPRFDLSLPPSVQKAEEQSKLEIQRLREENHALMLRVAAPSNADLTDCLPAEMSVVARRD